MFLVEFGSLRGELEREGKSKGEAGEQNIGGWADRELLVLCTAHIDDMHFPHGAILLSGGFFLRNPEMVFVVSHAIDITDTSKIIACKCFNASDCFACMALLRERCRSMFLVPG